ncbi:PTS sugar transporter subunit IIB [Glaesserella parasuis]|uniref:PTS sugar transporter subunit IIB n=1 Tax=Glaesserella parasuis TaxID=738 RepID=A0A859IF95_GLAPU|nr:PTS sugar transporter subunit IIB [Glaesserella parasuis]MDO9758442.1 PTS sugar transporter subunit IIB [Glaesserella parasuis]MWP98979.1 PTS sugar transporter subunit IIB [Glaesserella parasuis]MWQ44326.1 PTS sugar transporter subunit IIB [Glaesserella parasuis]MWQ60768.1 PTS sugar transporter subunit IIB [Glaesserella parasuis]QKY72609.1 PTS sugar transporter subunit IIB [Glaesserella parasuis]
MAILNVRIDGRLIHGQVANLWTSYLNITRIMVVDEIAANSDIDKAGLRLACPAGVNLSVLPVEKAAANINEGRYDSQRVLLVTRTPQTILQLVEAGVNLLEVNAGNMPKTDLTRPIRKTVHVTEDDVEVFRKLSEKGVKLTAQLVPNEEKVDLMKLL